VEADLERDNGWDLAIDNCDYVLHVASPFGGNRPMSEEEMIMPARDGTLRVLRAARAARVRRVVMTSSFGAIGYGHSPRSQPFTEKDWRTSTVPTSALTSNRRSLPSGQLGISLSARAARLNLL
jgi:dihydroflavonol-4-reductase